MGRGRGPMGATARKTVGSPVRVHSFVDLTQEDSEEAGTQECTSAARHLETVVTPPKGPVWDPTQPTSTAPLSRADGSSAPDAAPASEAGAILEEKSALTACPTGSYDPLRSTSDRQVNKHPLRRWTVYLLWGQHAAGGCRWALRAV
jgi:hypothetical protein